MRRCAKCEGPLREYRTLRLTACPKCDPIAVALYDVAERVAPGIIHDDPTRGPL